MSDPILDRRPNPLVFLSSIVSEIRPERAELYDYGHRYGSRSVWVDERCREPVGRDETSSHEHWPLDPNPFPDIDDYLRELRRSKLYVAWIASPRAGTPVRPRAGGSALATFFELELAYAAMLGRPIALVLVAGVQPSAELGYLIELVSRVVAVARYETASFQESVSVIKGIVDDVAHGIYDGVATTAAEYGLFLADRWTTRGNSLRWLANDWPAFSRHAAPDATVVDSALAEVANAKSAEQKLARLWVAAREVMCSPYWHADPGRQLLEDSGTERAAASEWLDEWNRVLTAWNSASAWYGLHGHVELGYLAALNSLADIRRIGRALEPGRREDPAWDAPWSAQASAYYAAARRVGSRVLRVRGLLKARWLLMQATYRDPLSRSNGLAILGSVDLQLGNIPGGLWAYWRALRLRERHGAPPGAIGEAMTELGYAWARLPGGRDRGLDLLRRGIAEMEGERYEAGFMVRAKFKLADILQRAGMTLMAEGVRAEALALAQLGTVGTAARDYSDPRWRQRE